MSPRHKRMSSIIDTDGVVNAVHVVQYRVELTIEIIMLQNFLKVTGRMQAIANLTGQINSIFKKQ